MNDAARHARGRTCAEGSHAGSNDGRPDGVVGHGGTWAWLLGVLLWVCGAHLLAVGARAGPVEAREAWRAAETLRTGPWKERVRALRRVRQLTHASDSVYARALAAEARCLRSAARVHAAAAAEAWVGALGADSDPDRAARLLVSARALRTEGDSDAALLPLLEAARVARPALPWQADEALDVLAEDAEERRDVERLEVLVLRMKDERTRPSSLVTAFDRLGLLRLAAEDVEAARACVRAMERAYREASGLDAREAARATRAWLDARLRAALRAR